jgi:hypothetical protein
MAWRRLDDVPGDALPWLYGVARRVLANQRRSADRGAALERRLASAAAPVGAPDPGDAEGDKELMRLALGRLSEPSREALMLVAWHGLTGARAARAAGCSRAAFAVRLCRATESRGAERGRRAAGAPACHARQAQDTAGRRAAPGARGRRCSELGGGAFAAFNLLESDAPAPGVVEKAVAAVTRGDVVYHVLERSHVRAAGIPEAPRTLLRSSPATERTSSAAELSCWPACVERWSTCSCTRPLALLHSEIDGSLGVSGVLVREQAMSKWIVSWPQGVGRGGIP